MNDWVSVREASKIIGCSVSYIHILVKGRTRANGKHEPPRFADVIHNDKTHYTWYYININEVQKFAKERKAWNKSKQKAKKF